MRRTLFALGMSAVLAMPLLANAQMSPSTPGAGSGAGAGGSGYSSQMGQEERRGHTDLQSTEVRQAQERLKEAGFNPGPVDGQLGAQTKDAIKDYQKAHGLPQTGQLDERTRELLMVQKTDGLSGERTTPGGTMHERTMPTQPMPSSRAPSDPGASAPTPGGSTSNR